MTEPSNSAANTKLPGTRPAGSTDEATAGRQVREMFSGIAPRYDLLNHLLSMRFDVMWRRRVARRFRELLARPDARVLDLCCGTGDLALALAAKAAEAAKARGANDAPVRPGVRILGADFAHPMLQIAREKSHTSPGSAPIEYLEADALALPFAGESFDLVTAAFGFRNLANYRSGLAEILRILRPGGSVAILEFTEPRGAVFGGLYRFYFRQVLPRIGGLISGDGGAYTYLPSSVARFPAPPELASLMGEVGFREVQFERWTGGIVALHIARR